MITHQHLVEEVASRARLDDSRAADAAVHLVLAALSRRLDASRCERLRQAVPAHERDAVVHGPGDPDESEPGPLSDLLAEIARQAGGTREQALFLAQTVMSQVTADEPWLVADLSGALPDEYGAVLAEPDAVPERTSRATQAPAPLSDEELAAALRQRPGWSGDTHELSRTVALPPDRVELLLTEVGHAANELGHRPSAQQTDDGVRFTVQTRSVRAVTALDLELADRIDDAVMAVGGGSAG